MLKENFMFFNWNGFFIEMDTGDPGFIFVKKLKEKIQNTEKNNGNQGFFFGEKKLMLYGY